MKPIVVVFLTVVLDLVGFGIVIPLMTFYAESFHASPWQVTLLMACFSLAQFFFAPLWGQLSDRIGRRPVMLISIGLTAVSLCAFASAQSLWMLYLFRALHGMMTANISTAQACMADLTTRENRAKGMGLIGAAFGIGFTLGPFIGGEFSRHNGVDTLSTPLWIAAGLSALNFVLALAFLPETRHPESTKAHRPISAAALYRAVTHPVMGLAIALSFLTVFSFALMESTFTLFAEHAHQMKAQDVGRMFGLVGVIGIVVQGGLIGRLVKRFGEARLIPVGLVLLVLGIGLLPFAPGYGALLCTFALIATGQGITNPSLQALISKAGSADEQGSVLGSSQSMGALARATGPALGGLLFSRIGPAAPFLVASAIVAIALGLAGPATRRAAAA